MEHAVFEGAKSAVVLFDGECNFCNSGVWMMISNSRARNLRFCAQNVSERGFSPKLCYLDYYVSGGGRTFCRSSSGVGG